LWWRVFFCKACRRTVSYLPHFALTYRLLHVDLVERFLEQEDLAPVQEKWRDLLLCYRRRLLAWVPSLQRIVGAALGRAPLRPEAFWPWIKKACGSLASATRRLVASWKVTLFSRHVCHQPGQWPRRFQPKLPAGTESLPR
jgi:hypothetical protein